MTEQNNSFSFDETETDFSFEESEDKVKYKDINYVIGREYSFCFEESKNSKIKKEIVKRLGDRCNLWEK